MYIVNNNRVELDETLQESKRKFLKKYNLKDKEITKFSLAKKSVDARDKNDIFYIESFYVDGKFKIKGKLSKNIKEISEEEVDERLPFNFLTSKYRPIIIGAVQSAKDPAHGAAFIILDKNGLDPRGPIAFRMIGFRKVPPLVAKDLRNNEFDIGNRRTDHFHELLSLRAISKMYAP